VRYLWIGEVVTPVSEQSRSPDRAVCGNGTYLSGGTVVLAGFGMMNSATGFAWPVEKNLKVIVRPRLGNALMTMNSVPDPSCK
jgi:hypothetical protein